MSAPTMDPTSDRPNPIHPWVGNSRVNSTSMLAKTAVKPTTAFMSPNIRWRGSQSRHWRDIVTHDFIAWRTAYSRSGDRGGGRRPRRRHKLLGGSSLEKGGPGGGEEEEGEDRGNKGGGGPAL